MNKLDFICHELQLNKEALFNTKDKRYRKTVSEVNKRWIAFLFFKRFNLPISQIAHILQFDRSSIYNCFKHATPSQHQAADMLYKMYTSPDFVPPEVVIYQTRLVPDYLHSRCEYRQVRVN